MAVKSKDVKRIAKKAVKNGKEIAGDVIDKAAELAEPAVKAIKKQAKRVAKAAEPRIKDAKKAYDKGVKQARSVAKDALYAGSKSLKKAAKKI